LALSWHAKHHALPADTTAVPFTDVGTSIGLWAETACGSWQLAQSRVSPPAEAVVSRVWPLAIANESDAPRATFAAESTDPLWQEMQVAAGPGASLEGWARMSGLDFA
jgi:hypothetical protein